MHALPELLPMIQTYLLDLLSLGLTRKPYREHLPTATAHSLAQAIQLGRPSSFPTSSHVCLQLCCQQRTYHFGVQGNCKGQR